MILKREREKKRWEHQKVDVKTEEMLYERWQTNPRSYQGLIMHNLCYFNHSQNGFNHFTNKIKEEYIGYLKNNRVDDICISNSQI